MYIIMRVNSRDLRSMWFCFHFLYMNSNYIPDKLYVVHLLFKVKKKLIANLGHSCHSPDKNDFPNVSLFCFSILKSFLTRSHGTFNKVFHNGFKLTPSQFQVHVFRAWWIHGEVWQIDVSLSWKYKVFWGSKKDVIENDNWKLYVILSFETKHM